LGRRERADYQSQRQSELGGGGGRNLRGTGVLRAEHTVEIEQQKRSEA